MHHCHNKFICIPFHCGSRHQTKWNEMEKKRFGTRIIYNEWRKKQKIDCWKRRCHFDKIIEIPRTLNNPTELFEKAGIINCNANFSPILFFFIQTEDKYIELTARDFVLSVFMHQSASLSCQIYTVYYLFIYLLWNGIMHAVLAKPFQHLENPKLTQTQDTSFIRQFFSSLFFLVTNLAYIIRFISRLHMRTHYYVYVCE